MSFRRPSSKLAPFSCRFLRMNCAIALFDCPSCDIETYPACSDASRQASTGRSEPRPCCSRSASTASFTFTASSSTKTETPNEDVCICQVLFEHPRSSRCPAAPRRGTHDLDVDVSGRARLMLRTASGQRRAGTAPPGRRTPPSPPARRAARAARYRRTSGFVCVNSPLPPPTMAEVACKRGSPRTQTPTQAAPLQLQACYFLSAVKHRQTHLSIASSSKLG